MRPIDAAVQQGCEAVFPKAEFDRRVAAARIKLAERDIDVFIVTSPENIFYLTGQQTPGYYTFQAILLPVDGEPHFIVRQLEMPVRQLYGEPIEFAMPGQHRFQVGKAGKVSVVEREAIM